MTTTSKIALSEGSGKYAATYSFSEDAVTKEIQRTTLSRSDGSEVPLTGAGAYLEVVPTVTASTYAAGVVIGGIMTFASMLAVNVNGNSGVLENLTVKFKGSVQTVGVWVALFDTSPGGTFSNTSAAAIASGDTAHLIGMWHLTLASSMLGTHTVYNLDGVGHEIVAPSTSLYAVVVPDGTTATLGSPSDMTVGVGILW